jgi:hypothetical protein
VVYVPSPLLTHAGREVCEVLLESSLEKGMDKMVIPNRVRVLAVMVALALAIGVLTLALLAKPTQAEPPTANENRGATSQWVEIGFMVDSTDCAGELIRFTGTMHFVDRFFETDGGYHLRLHYNFAGVRGVGLNPQTLEPTGTEYTVTSAGGVVEHFLPTGSTVNTTVDNLHIIGKGQAATSRAHSLVHFILEDVVPGEEPTVKMDTIHINFDCDE